MDKVVADGEIVDGQVVMPATFWARVGSLMNGKKITVTVERLAKKRSLNQNAYYWGVLIPHLQTAFFDIGENLTKEEIHAFLKHQYLRTERENPKTNELLTFIRSTSNLKVYEFGLYIEQCLQFAAQSLDYVIPTPADLQAEYLFPEYQQDKEPRAEYLARIREYCLDIFDVDGLTMYFKQNAEWEKSDDVKAIFRERYNEIRSHANKPS